MTAYDLVSKILSEMEGAASKPGVCTIDLDRKIGRMIKKHGARSINKGYKHPTAKAPWPFYSCINVNNIIAHGYPSAYVLQDGDIVSVDIGLELNGKLADAAISFGVGNVSNKRQKLLRYAKRITLESMEYMTEGFSTEDLAQIIESKTIGYGYLVNRRFAGHRIGETMHEKPNIYNTCEKTHVYDKLKLNDIYCIEPMITTGRDNMGATKDPNNWEWQTADGADSAFFEVMVQITKDGPKKLTNHI